MIKEIDFRKFKKLININFSFDDCVNLISGTNGTCKTTLLHLISNSFQMPLIRSPNYANTNCLKVIKTINKIANPKMEAIVRESKNYTDPAEGTKGNLFSINYLDDTTLDFRKHNSKNPDEAHRYAIKPLYPRGGVKQSLPSKPVLYLGLSRLFPIGETKDGDLTAIPLNLPEKYVEIISNIYKDFLGINITNIQSNNIGDFKSGPSFDTDNPEIDSNTISSGEDNLFIIVKALVSLRYYFESLIESNDSKESILLIDEFDATLHPSLQIRLLDKIHEYAKAFKIQVFFTTHSLTLLEHAFHKKYCVIYLINNITKVLLMEEPNLLKITMHLKTQTKDETYTRNKIPIFTEDREARFLFKEIFSYWISKNSKLAIVESYLHLVDCSIGADNLKTIFSDPHLKETSLKSICVLDGDHGSDLNKGIVALPGGKAPEQLIFEHCEKTFNDDDASFWENEDILNNGFTKELYLSVIRPKIISIEEKIQQKKNNEESVSGLRRALNKDVFIKHIEFFRMITRNWLDKDENKAVLSFYYKGLQTLFFKATATTGVDRKIWDFDYSEIFKK
ncbi:AAA family ATPase [Pectobacterium parmentieri]|uniref:AAA family ATPase n=1 Tax=Enterobacterales TaxID=91347 RepID=UPI001CC0334D|nr:MULTISPECIES: AAA family ATPase [Enterobacterales]MCL6354306.1 AAA family ATPase [Pectobacterium parmentieri]MCS3607434.1 AAA15 family ATPase/GTPase [Erwinia rhapontici]